MPAPLLYKRVHEANLTGPGVLKKLDFERIGAQYLTDARYMASVGRISLDQYSDIEQWTRKVTNRRKLRTIFSVERPSLRQLRSEILPSPDLRIRDKLLAIKRYMGRFM